MLVSLRIFAEELNGGWVALESDNTSTLQAALEFRASSPLMLALAAEVSLELEANALELQFAHHIRGVANYEADALSRLILGQLFQLAFRLFLEGRSLAGIGLGTGLGQNDRSE